MQPSIGSNQAVVVTSLTQFSGSDDLVLNIPQRKTTIVQMSRNVADLEQVSGNYSFSDIIGATATQVYRLGCYVHDHNCTTVTDSKTPGSLVRPGHSFGKSHCLVLNGGFEYVDTLILLAPSIQSSSL